MKKTLRMIAALLMIGSIAFWTGAGANHGWTKRYVPTKIKDEVTGLEGVRWQRRFVPGIDFLGATWLGAGALTALSFRFRRNKGNPQIETKP